VIPAPVFVGAATGAYPWPFAGYEVIGGATACSVAISEEDRLRLAVPLGRFLRALHAIDPAPLVELGLPPDEIARLDHAKRLRIVGERIPSLVAAGAIDGDALMAWFRTHPPEPIADAKRTLVHGDLYARHILVDDARMPTGVIDWATCIWAIRRSTSRSPIRCCRSQRTEPLETPTARSTSVRGTQPATAPSITPSSSSTTAFAQTTPACGASAPPRCSASGWAFQLAREVRDSVVQAKNSH
jgi:hypothetical protein